MSKILPKEKKLRRKINKEENLKQENITFDIFSLLRDNSLDTKPQVGDFLKKYVKSIRIMVNYSKIMLYPVLSFEISSVFVDFLDGHQIISDFSKAEREYHLYKGLEEIELSEKERKIIVSLIVKLQEFHFIYT